MKLTKTLMATTALSVAAGAAVAEDMAMEMTFVSWGGAYQASQVKAYIEPYLELNPGLKVTYDESTAEATAKMRAMSEAGNVTWDVVDAVISDTIRMCDEGLAMEIDHDAMLAKGDDGSLPTEDWEGQLVSDCYIPLIVYSTTFGYRTDLVGDTKPTSVCDIFDTAKYPGKRALQKRPIDNLEWALYCDGVAKDEIYDVLSEEEGVDRALAKLDTIKDQVVWWTAGAETPQLLADGEVVFGSTFNGRLFSAIAEQGQPIDMLWDMQSYDLDGLVIPADLPADRLARALDFVKFATDTKRQADQAAYISYGPARKSSAPLVGKHKELGIEMAPHMPTDPANATNVHMYDYEWWADNRDDMNARFEAWLAK
jgi:putative spermidine/putrescine transport system substrate-binding protein